MSDWLHNLPVPWMAVVVFGLTYLLAAIIFTDGACRGRACACIQDRLSRALSAGPLPHLEG